MLPHIGSKRKHSTLKMIRTVRARSTSVALRSVVARLSIRCENVLTITGAEASVQSFEQGQRAADQGLAFVPRGLAFTGSASRLSFQRLLPIEMPLEVEHTLEHPHLDRWGCSTDAMEVELLPGRPRLPGRRSVIYAFVTGEHAPLAWLERAAVAHPQLRLGLKYAKPELAEAHQIEYNMARRTHATQVSYAAWVWERKVDSTSYFCELRRLLRFPDNRVPRKRKLTLDDVYARLQLQDTYEHAIGLLGDRVSGWDRPKRRIEKLFNWVVLPQFIVWLRSADGLNPNFEVDPAR